MSPRPIIFLGPSLSRAEARAIVDADFRPPLRAGDLEALPDGSIVGIVDGVLDASSRLPPCEAVRAIARCEQLYGAASTGALLAAQLRDTPFIGLGRVFELVDRHPEAADDLVAVFYVDPEGPALTEPLANAVLSFIDRWRPHDSRLVDELIEALRAIPIEKWAKPTVEDCLRDLAHATEHFSLTPILRNYKAEDARLLLQRLARPTGA